MNGLTVQKCEEKEVVVYVLDEQRPSDDFPRRVLRRPLVPASHKLHRRLPLFQSKNSVRFSSF